MHARQSNPGAREQTAPLGAGTDSRCPCTGRGLAGQPGAQWGGGRGRGCLAWCTRGLAARSNQSRAPAASRGPAHPLPRSLRTSSGGFFFSRGGKPALHSWRQADSRLALADRSLRRRREGRRASPGDQGPRETLLQRQAPRMQALALVKQRLRHDNLRQAITGQSTSMQIR